MSTPTSPSSSASASSGITNEDESFVIPSSEFDCPLCCSLLYEPITTPTCGHTFCRSCLTRALLNKKTCPLCRQPCTNVDGESHATTQILHALLQKYGNGVYQERARETAIEKKQRKPRYGLFISNFTQFPGAILRLHIYEPRYRILIHRALSTTREFIVVCARQPRDHPSIHTSSHHQHQQDTTFPVPTPTIADNVNTISTQHTPATMEYPLMEGQTAPYEMIHPGDMACLVKIKHCRAHPDGRSFVEAVGVSRVKLDKILEEENADGLLSAECDIMIDEEEHATFGISHINDEMKSVSPSKLRHRHRLSMSQARGSPIISSTSTSTSTAEPCTSYTPTSTSTYTSTSTSTSTSSTDASTSSSTSTSTTTSSDDETLEQRLQRCARLTEHLRERLQQYIVASSTTMERLIASHGAIPDNMVEFSWWIAMNIPADERIKGKILQAESLLTRLTLCDELVTAAISASHRRSQIHSYFVLVILIVAFLYHVSSSSSSHHAVTTTAAYGFNFLQF